MPCKVQLGSPLSSFRSFKQMRSLKKRILFAFTTKLFNGRAKNELAKTIRKYTTFQAQMQGYLTENKPETHWPVIALFFEIIDFNILDKLLLFAKDLAIIFDEFQKALRGEEWNRSLVQGFQVTKIEFQKIVETFFEYLNKNEK